MTIMNNIAYLTKQIEEAVDHPTLYRFIKKPNVDRDHLLVLLNIFEEDESIDEPNDYILSISLVHLALNTHDQIRLEQAETDQEKKLRQLTVLAGDYYSSQYYQLLAKQSDFKMIKHVSDAIQKINEYKTSFFQQELGIQKWFELIKKIESTLLISVSECLGLSKWKDLISDYFFIKRLLSERQRVMNGQMSKFLHHITKGNADQMNHVIQLVDQAILEGCERLATLHPNSFPLIEDLTHATLFQSRTKGVGMLVEEG